MHVPRGPDCSTGCACPAGRTPAELSPNWSFRNRTSSLVFGDIAVEVWTGKTQGYFCAGERLRWVCGGTSGRFDHLDHALRGWRIVQDAVDVGDQRLHLLLLVADTLLDQLQFGQPVVEGVGGFVDALDAFQAPAQLDLMLAHL